MLALSIIQGALVAWPMVFAFGLAFSYYENVYIATAMDATDPHIAASMFSILLAVANIGTGLGPAIMGGLSASLGYRGTFQAISAARLLAFPLILVAVPRRAASELGDEQVVCAAD